MVKFWWCVKVVISVSLLANLIQFLPAPAEAYENLEQETENKRKDKGEYGGISIRRERGER